MFSKPQIHHKSTPRPNFAIILNSFDIKTHAQPQNPKTPCSDSRIESQFKLLNHKMTEVEQQENAVPETENVEEPQREDGEEAPEEAAAEDGYERQEEEEA